MMKQQDSEKTVQSPSKAKPKSREERLAEQLRANLRRRKSQSRARAETDDADE